MKRLFALFLVLILCLHPATSALGAKPLDQRIFTENPQNIYIGEDEGREMINNLNFDDIPTDFWAKESITRTGAVNMVKHFDSNFHPNENVSNQDAIAFIIRAIGMEQQAEDRAVLLASQTPSDNPLETQWAIGYLDIAKEIGIISNAQYNDAITPNQKTLDPNKNFVREASAKREDIADWLVKGLLYIEPTTFDTLETQQNIYEYPDWSDLSVDKVKSMESVLKAGIFNGNEGNLNPKGNMSRAQMAQTLKNMDNIYYNLVSITKKIGTIGGIKDAQTSTTESDFLERDFYIRNQNGAVDIIQYQMSAKEISDPTEKIKDVVVFKNSEVVGLSKLEQGDKIEYLVRPETGEVVYIQVLDEGLENKNVKGRLKSVDINNGLLTITDITDKNFTYPMNQDLYDTILSENAQNTLDSYISIDGKKINTKELPIGSNVSLSLKNGIISSIDFLGETSVILEEWGVIVENNPNFGYLTYIDNKNNYITKNYISDEIVIEKQKYYDKDDEIGYIDESFSNLSYDPRDVAPKNIEVGDIVFMRFDPQNLNNIIFLSASPNYSEKHGKILEITDNGHYFSMLFEYEDKQTDWFNAPKNIYISKDGKPISISTVKCGDEAKILINQGNPDYLMQNIKEMVVTGDEDNIQTIVKGTFTGINETQNTLSIQNPKILNNEGWSISNDVSNYDISNKDIQYFQDGNEISLDYAKQYLVGKDDVYLALENNYSGDKVKKVTFRSERDELLEPDTILTSSGNGDFTMLSNPKTITTDDGTIVRRNNRLVNANDIESSDYAVVSLNGDNAAIVDIYPAPNVSGLDIFTARISHIDEGKSFEVKSMARLNNDLWDYTSTQRIFTIDQNTLFLNGNGAVDERLFKDYGDNSYGNQVVNIVSSGANAERIILGDNESQVPYAKYAISGTIYIDNAENNQKENETSIFIKDATYLQENTGNWKTLNKDNPIATINIDKDTIIVNNNALATDRELLPGQQIKIMTETNPEEINGEIKVNGRIVLVEK